MLFRSQATATPRATGTPTPEPTDDEWVFVGYHGTSSLYGPDLIGIGTVRLPNRQNFAGSQLGLGFYTSTNPATAQFFADNAAASVGGSPIILRVYARGVARMVPSPVPQQYWWNIGPGSPYMLPPSLTAPVAGFPMWPQVKFNPVSFTLCSLKFLP